MWGHGEKGGGRGREEEKRRGDEGVCVREEGGRERGREERARGCVKGGGRRGEGKGSTDEN